MAAPVSHADLVETEGRVVETREQALGGLPGALSLPWSIKALAISQPALR